MEIPIVDLKIFAQKYRQALLYTMIEGLNKGASFVFSDDRDPNEIESELTSAGLQEFRWAKSEENGGGYSYLIERNKPDELEAASCCGCCCGQSKNGT